MSEIEQGTDAWLALRAGAFTASRMADIMAKTRSGPSASRKNMIATLAVERVNGQCVETYQNAAMARGIELEAEARAAYSFETCQPVEEIAYIKHPSIPHCGCSPDGLIGDDGMVELKVPSSMAKHMDALLTGAHAREYRWQLQHQLFVTGREWCDAVSYDPRWGPGLTLAITRVFKGTEDHENLAAEIAKAEAEIQEIVNQLQKIREQAA